jgi:lipid-A-disaccharide synthase
MHLFISAGEPSGDLHGSNLIRSLQKLDPCCKIVGFGGDKMQAAGAELLYPLTKLAVMWFLRAILNIFTFLRLLKKAKNYFRDQKPDAVILIDFPGFHFALAKRAHSQGIPVYWFVPPQLWAWAGWRVKKMHKWVKHILCSLPFEEKWFKEQGMACSFVGHPYFDEMLRQILDQAFLTEEKNKTGRRIALLPGSRGQEVSHNFASMVRAAKIIHEQDPNTRFLVASFNESQAKKARELIRDSKTPIEVHVQKTPEIIHLSEACISVSGSVGLELMYSTLPTVVIYRISWLALRVSRRFMKCRFISLVNLLAEKELYPEFLVDHDPAEEMAKRILFWLNHPEEMRNLRNELQSLKDCVVQTGASDRAAQFLMRDLSGASITDKKAA